MHFTKSISEARLHVFLYKAGVTRTTTEALDLLRTYFIKFLQKLVENVNVFTLANGRKTFTIEDLENSILALNLTSYSSINKFTKDHKFESCSLTDSTIGIGRKIRHYGGLHKLCLIIPKTKFKKIIIKMTHALGTRKPRFAKNVINFLQLTAETFAVKFCKDAWLITQNAKRKTLQSEDLKLIYELKRN